MQVEYGKNGIEISPPAGATILRADHPSDELSEADVRRSLESPIASVSLAKLLRDKKPSSVAITISDITRAVPNRQFLPAILGCVEEAGVAADSVVIVIGTGMHRPSTEEERRVLVGEAILQRYNVIDHRADDPTTLLKMSSDPYVAINRQFAEADFRIVTGFIEPHFMAGFSGGRKGVCPALVDLSTVQRFHGYATLADPMAREGVLDGNPCHETALGVAELVGVDFLFNVSVASPGGIAGVYCGDLIEAHVAGCEDVAASSGVAIDEPYDIVVTSGGGYPLDQTFYQTVKGLCMALPAVKPGGALLIASDCSEQLGSEEYTKLMMDYAGRWRDFLSDIAANSGRTQKDQWEFQMQCRVFEKVRPEEVYLFSDGLSPEMQEVTGLNPVPGSAPVASRLQQTLDRLVREKPDARVAIVPDGPYTMLKPR